ncbi:MAG: transcription antitermination factor NusB [Rhodospirillales bacterium]|nr:transcription antitermination factor NusB [Rhodospirillales bacterium]
MNNDLSSQDSLPEETGGKARGRSYARLAAVQALYEMDIAGAGSEAVLRDFLANRWAGTLIGNKDDEGNNAGAPVKTDHELLSELVQGVSGRSEELDLLIAPALSGDRDLERMETLLKAIFRAGTFELVDHDKIPAKIIISEYVDIAHAFFSGPEPGLVNGVLDNLARTLRPDDFEAK